MRRRGRRRFWVAAGMVWGLSALAATACRDQAPDDGIGGSAGAGGGTIDASGGTGDLGGRRGDGDGGTNADRTGGAGSGGRRGSGGSTAIPDCLDDVTDDRCVVAMRTAMDGWNCTVRFPRDSLGAEDAAAIRVFVGCEEAGMGGGAGSGNRGQWTFDDRTDTLQLGRAVCESAADGVVVTAIAGCD